MSFEEKFKKGYELLHEKDLDKSLDISRELQKMNPESADGFILEAEVMQKLNQWEPSISSLNEAIEKDPESGRLYNLRGYALLNLEKFEEAGEDLIKAIKLADLSSAHRNLVLFKLLTGDGKGAIEYLLDRIKTDPRDVENWILMGDLMKKGGHDQKAQSYYEQALKMAPDNEYVQKQLEE
ncbi:MAG: tetratricopeptide repeat protein [Balneolaceae bacterium]